MSGAEIESGGRALRSDGRGTGESDGAVAVPVGLDDLGLLERFEPVIRFNEGEYFLPASVEAFVGASELWERTGPSSRRLVAPAGSLDLDRLVDLADGEPARHYLRLVSRRPTRAESFGWRVDRDRPRFRAETRLGRVGVLTRLVDAAARFSLLARGRTPRGAQTAAALLDRARPDHGDHPYYGRVVRSAGYTVLQYWFFSFFNDWRSRAYGVNDHEGDWEQVTIYLVEPGDATLQPAWVAFSAHDEVGPDLRRRWDDPDLLVVDGHPVVNAGLGSHAGAVLPGEYLVTVRTTRLARVTGVLRSVTRFLQPWTHDEEQRSGVGIPYVEYARGDGVAIGPGCDHPWRRVLVDDDTPWIRSYTGLWGDDTNDPFGGERGPAGPRYERDATVRPSWSDPVGWAALDAVAPNDAVRRDAVEARIDELTVEYEQLDRERADRRRRLRADAVAGVPEAIADERILADLAARSTRNIDERARLSSSLAAPAVVHYPHAHLRHRAIPLPVESGERRRVLRIWATISTPLVFVLLAMLVNPGGPSLLVLAAIGLLGVLAIEAFTRGRLVSFALRIAAATVALAIAAAVVAGLIESWRVTVVIMLLVMAAVFLVLNLSELRRT